MGDSFWRQPRLASELSTAASERPGDRTSAIVGSERMAASI